MISRVGWDQKKRKEFLNDIFNKKSPIPISIVQGGSPGLGKGKSWRKQVQPIQLGHSGIDSYVNVFETTTPFLEFSIEFQSNDSTQHQKYTKRQELM